MTSIKVENVSVEIPVFDVTTRSLRGEFFKPIFENKRISNKRGIKIVNALQDITFNAVEGDAIGVLGANGSGKTSLLRLISGIYQPTRGSIKVDGEVFSLLSLGAGIEMSLTGRENIKRLHHLYRVDAKYDDEFEAKIIEFSDLGDFIDLPVRTYSSGMVMRLMFSSMLLNRPDIFILDEFFSTGDKDFSEKAELKMAEQASNSSLFFFSSHSHETIKRYCNRFFLMDGGRLIEISKTDF